jgi:co-chaperonin GroES (HSP10)
MKTLINGSDAEYAPAKWDGKNTSGLRVTGKAILVKMDECTGKTIGGTFLPEDFTHKMTMQSVSGVLIAVSEGSFLVNEDFTPWSGYKPKPGDRVHVEQYSGRQIAGKDGHTYRIMDYGCVGGVYEPDEPKGATGNVASG